MPPFHPPPRPPVGRQLTPTPQINYDLDTGDFNERYDESRAIVTSGVAKKASVGGSFLTLLHENHERSVTELLQFVIDEARKYNFEFVTVGECLGDPVNNWYRDPATGGPWGGPAAPPPPIKSTTSSSSSSSSSSSESVSSSTTSASKPELSESAKSNSTTTTGAGLTTVTSTSTTLAPKTTTPAATTTPTPKPNVAGRVEGLGWMGGMLLGALGVFAGL